MLHIHPFRNMSYLLNILKKVLVNKLTSLLACIQMYMLYLQYSICRTYSLHKKESRLCKWDVWRNIYWCLKKSKFLKFLVVNISCLNNPSFFLFTVSIILHYTLHEWHSNLVYKEKKWVITFEGVLSRLSHFFFECAPRENFKYVLFYIIKY